MIDLISILIAKIEKIEKLEKYSFLVDGQWGEWMTWSQCSHSCGGGQRDRQRQCDDPQPQFGGADCVGADVQTDYCNNDPCPGQSNFVLYSQNKFKENKQKQNLFICKIFKEMHVTCDSTVGLSQKLIRIVGTISLAYLGKQCWTILVL